MDSESQTVTSLIKQATIAVCFLGKMAEHVKNFVFIFKILVPSYFASSRKHTRESTRSLKEYKKFERQRNNVFFLKLPSEPCSLNVCVPFSYILLLWENPELVMFIS